MKSHFGGVQKTRLGEDEISEFSYAAKELKNGPNLSYSLATFRPPDPAGTWHYSVTDLFLRRIDTGNPIPHTPVKDEGVTKIMSFGNTFVTVYMGNALCK